MPSIEDHPSTWYRASDEDFLAYSGKVPGFWPVDKPAGMTSRRAVDAVRKHLGVHKAGHTGTLDPPATGVLVVAVEKALKVVRYAETWSKTYEGTVLFGLRTDTWDTSGKVLEEQDASGLSRGEIEEFLNGMRGYVEQATPPVSAVRHGGKRLYELARKGEYHSPMRRVRIDAVEIIDFKPPRLDFRIECGRGTYVRSIAWALGERIGCGAVLESLRRTREGPFDASLCIAVPGLE